MFHFYSYSLEVFNIILIVFNKFEIVRGIYNLLIINIMHSEFDQYVDNKCVDERVN